MADIMPLAIFWDLENCRASSNTVDLLMLVGRIQSLLQPYGNTVLFQGYLEMKSDSPLQDHLVSAGVTLKDCPHSGKKNVVDDKIISDIKGFIFDNIPDICAVVLISGDGDFIDVLSRVRDLGHTVVVISCDDSSSLDLKLLAHSTMSWNWICKQAIQREILTPPSFLGKRRRVEEVFRDESDSDMDLASDADETTEDSEVEKRPQLADSRPSQRMPARFLALARLLDKLDRQGVSRPIRSLVASKILMSHPGVLKLAGVKKFRKYALQAEAAGVVILGKSGKENWISLHPDWQRGTLDATLADITLAAPAPMIECD